MPINPPSPRTRVKRSADKAKYDDITFHSILDATPLCTVGYIYKGHPYVTPTLHWREGCAVYWHGSSASRMMEACVNAPVCLTVTLLDGLVLARSAFNHSVNYRSVMVMGTAQQVQDADEKAQHLKTMMEQLFPGRWDKLRPHTPKELKATMLLKLPLDEASAKLRQGPPDDDIADRVWPIWAGEIPLRTQTLALRGDSYNQNNIEPDPVLQRFHIGGYIKD